MSSVIVVIVFSPKNFLCLCLSVSHSLSLSLPFSIFHSHYLQLSPLLSVISFSLFTPLPFSFLPFSALLYCSFLFSSLLFSFLSSLFFPFLICSSHPTPLFSLLCTFLLFFFYISHLWTSQLHQLPSSTNSSLQSYPNNKLDGLLSVYTPAQPEEPARDGSPQKNSNGT